MLVLQTTAATPPLGLRDPRSIIQGRNTLFRNVRWQGATASRASEGGREALLDRARRPQQRGTIGSCLGRQLCQIW